MKLLQMPFWDLFKSLDKYPYYFDQKTYWLYVSLTFLSLCGIALISMLIYGFIYKYLDYRSSTKKTLSGKLVDKRYICEQFGLGTYVIFVKADNVYKMEVDMQQFYDKNIGEKIMFEVIIGGMSKDELNIEFIE